MDNVPTDIITFKPFEALKNIIQADVPDPISSDRQGDYIVSYRLREVSQDLPRISIIYSSMRIDHWGGGAYKYDKLTQTEEWLYWARLNFFIEAIDRIDNEEYQLPSYDPLVPDEYYRGSRFVMWFLDRCYNSLKRNRDTFKRDYGMYVNVADASDIYQVADNLVGARINVSIDIPSNSKVEISPGNVINLFTISITT